MKKSNTKGTPRKKIAKRKVNGKADKMTDEQIEQRARDCAGDNLHTAMSQLSRAGLDPEVEIAAMIGKTAREMCCSDHEYEKQRGMIDAMLGEFSGCPHCMIVDLIETQAETQGQTPQEYVTRANP